MVPRQAPQPAVSTAQSSLPPLRPLNRGNTLPAPSPSRAYPTDRLLAPEDAIYAGSPPRKPSAAVSKLQKDLRMTNGGSDDSTRPHTRGRHKDRSSRSGSRRRKGTWKKLLWVKQSCKSYLLVSEYDLTCGTQMRTITLIRIHFSNTSNVIHDFSPTTFGR